MTVLFIDGFGHYTDILEKWDDAFFGAHYADQSVGRFVPGAMKITGSGGGGHRDVQITSEADEYTVGFAYLHNFPSTLNDGKFYLHDQLGTELCSLTIVTAGSYCELDHNGSDVIRGGLVPQATWTWIEFRIKVHATLGELEIRVGTNTVALVTGIDTTNGNDSGLGFFRVVADNNSQSMWIDDLYVSDSAGAAPANGFLGDVRVTTLYPVDVGTATDFTPLSGTNFSQTSETLHDGDASYVESGSIGATDNYVMQSFAQKGVVPATIYAAQVVNAQKKTDAGSIEYTSDMVIGGSYYDKGETDQATSTLYHMGRYIMSTDPSDDSTWTQSKIEAINGGFTLASKDI